MKTSLKFRNLDDVPFQKEKQGAPSDYFQGFLSGHLKSIYAILAIASFVWLWIVW